MSSKIFTEYRNEIKTYCAANRLGFDKLLKSPYCYGEDDLVFLYRDPNERGVVERNGKWIIDDSTLMPATLEIYLENGKLRFVQTDITHKYLGVNRETAQPSLSKTTKTPKTSVQKLAHA